MKPSNAALGGAPPLMALTQEFQAFYQLYSDAVYKTALRVTGNAADAEDVLQTVFLRILDRKLTIDPSWSPAGYMRRAATNASIDLLRRKAALSETDLEDRSEFGARESSPLLKEHLRRALAKLPEQDAELFVLCYLEGYSYEELAQQFGLERGTIASRLFRIRAVLQKALSKS